MKSERAKGIGPLILGEKWGGWSIKCADFEVPCVNKKCERWKGENGHFEIGFDWVCFFRVRGDEHFDNALLSLKLRSFERAGKLGLIGFVLALIGFVFVGAERRFIFVILCYS
ncbi:MAG: hypothetical protein JSV99_11340 [Planctomycetota bacterium]|nr:MAG: hypothetical protein JSV99_11340 [Planctomycetota bacterium]